MKLVLEIGPTVAIPFAFTRPLDTWARWFAIVPSRSYVRVDDHGFEAVYGRWRIASDWSNVATVERTGPYLAWKTAGPGHGDPTIDDRQAGRAAPGPAHACDSGTRSRASTRSD